MTGIILGIGNSAALFAPKGTPFDPKDVIELVDPEQPHVSVFDLSVLRGDGIFEATTGGCLIVCVWDHLIERKRSW